MYRSRVIVTANIPLKRKFRNPVKKPDEDGTSTLINVNKQETNEVCEKIIKTEEIINEKVPQADSTINKSSDNKLNSEFNDFDKIKGKVDADADNSNICTPAADKPKTDDIPVTVDVTDGPDTVTDVPGAVPDSAADASDTGVSDAESVSIIAATEPKKSVTNSETGSQSKLLSRGCFMRPVPRLDGHGRIRRNSVQGSGASASESEDDSRRHFTVPINTNGINNNKTDSLDNNQCSIKVSFSSSNSNNNNVSNNNNNNSNTDNETSTSLTKSNVRQKKKIVISESARKLAEARREFQLKYENHKPDRAKLTMYDLIHYNPSTNPMKQIETSNRDIALRCQASEEELEADIDADDPEDGGMPAPQVKVGPDGQLILDEQSLVIERTGVAKQREALANSEAIIDDNIYGSGFYKQRSRMKEWPKWETIKFYKALSTIGTDFSLMKSLFPKRSRNDIKRKYKKEEKINRKLVEKALSSGLHFDVDLLKQELESFDKLEAISKHSGDKIKKGRRKKAQRRIAVTSLGQAALDNEENQEVTDKKSKKPPGNKSTKPDPPVNKKKKKLKRARSISIQSNCDDSADAGSESDTEVYRPRPTRSGRVPKPKKLRINSKHILDNILGDKLDDVETPSKDTPDPIAGDKILSLERDENSGADISNVEPGSLVIVSSESAEEPGKTEVQVYMVKSTDAAQNSPSGSGSEPVLATEMISVVTKNLISHHDELDID
ncbi:uncharacterized protein LOC130676143 [Microplitis mediator]|uniref:uncharacterized protein LOC130676143 n=1 Tax=Microplitis mediator TaxID=375433 RepID=UPI002553FC39|nr:uncharacterized protein LOC130676143 [Microplitis mediator]